MTERYNDKRFRFIEVPEGLTMDMTPIDGRRGTIDVKNPQTAYDLVAIEVMQTGKAVMIVGIDVENRRVIVDNEE
jgi:hypothetical protein